MINDTYISEIFKFFRFDYFLIWNHGIPHLKEVLEIIDNNSKLKIISIIKYKVPTLSKFIKLIYSHDYAPLWHLKSKTKYLLSSGNEVCFIFVKNNEPNEDYFGEGNFRHKESLTIKIQKEQIRDIFNSYENKIRSHNHVIHASDNQSQTSSILKYLGYKGINSFLTNNKFINMPYFINNVYKYYIQEIDVNDLYCNINFGNSWDNYTQNIVKLVDSPHYISISNNFQIYENYIRKFIGGPLTAYHSTENFKKLNNNFSYLSEPFSNHYIITKDINNKYVIIDGLHRASIYAHTQKSRIITCTITH